MPVWSYLIPNKSTLSPCATALGVCQYIDATGPTNVWVAVNKTDGHLSGSTASPAVNVYQWNGSAWVNHPYTSSGNISCGGLRVFSATDVWMAAGLDMVHWNGTAWIAVWTANLFEGGPTMGAKDTNTVSWVVNDSEARTDRLEHWTWDGSVFNMAWVFLPDELGNLAHPGTGSFGNTPGTWMLNDGSLYLLADRRYSGHELESLLRIGGAGDAILREYPDFWFMHSLWLQNQTHGWIVGDKQGAVYPPVPVLEMGMGGGWGEQTLHPIYNAQDPDDTVTVWMQGVGGKDESDVLICGKFSVSSTSDPTRDFHGWVIDRRIAGVWAHYSFPIILDASAWTQLFAIYWLANTDIWVVGGQTCEDFKLHTKILHWNGSSWENTRAIPPGL